jgi:pyruvate dehydrogenase E2 component (dihydrolipoamide acetyltransferase)
MKLQRAKNTSIFRKVAMATWKTAADPSVYGFIEFDVTHVGNLSSPMPAIIKAIAQTMKDHPELNSIIRFGRIYYRQQVNISVLVNIVEGRSKDLSFATLENVDQMSMEEIAENVAGSADLIRQRKDPKLGVALKLVKYVPVLLVRALLNTYSFFVHDVNMNLDWLKLPSNPFGSMIITNVGSLGINKALVPLVPFTRASVLISIGKIVQEPRVVNDQIVIRKIMHLGVTFDHRFFDGSHAATMIKDFERHFIELSGTD